MQFLPARCPFNFFTNIFSSVTFLKNHQSTFILQRDTDKEGLFPHTHKHIHKPVSKTAVARNLYLTFRFKEITRRSPLVSDVKHKSYMKMFMYACTSKVINIASLQNFEDLSEGI
jgi:hypothetical protein